MEFLDAIKEKGFSSASQFHAMVASLELTGPGHLEAFRKWQHEDGSIAGLEKLPTRERATIIATQDHIGAFVEGYAVPKEHQGKGIGRREYEKWEASLPKTLKYVGLQATPTSIGFWLKMGFKVMVEGEMSMVKGINGHPIPNMEE